MKKSWKNWFTTNLSYKLVALFVTIVLWISVKGEKEISFIDIPIEFELSIDQIIMNVVPHKVRVEIMGPRVVLKKYFHSSENLKIIKNFKNEKAGGRLVYLNRDEIPLTRGLKIISITPESFYVQLQKNERNSFEKGTNGEGNQNQENSSDNE